GACVTCLSISHSGLGTSTVRNIRNHRRERRLSAIARERGTKCWCEKDNGGRVYWRNRSGARAQRPIDRVDARWTIESTPEIFRTEQGPSRDYGRPDRPEKPVRSAARLESIAIAGET